MILLVNTIKHSIELLKCRPTDVKSDSYAKYYVYSNEKKYPKFKVGDHVRISNTKTFLLKDMFLTGQKKFCY